MHTAHDFRGHSPYREEFLQAVANGTAKCVLCGGKGPFKTPEQVTRETKGEYNWDNVCIRCRTGR